MLIRNPTHDTLGTIDKIRYVSLGTMYRFTWNQLHKDDANLIHDYNISPR